MKIERIIKEAETLQPVSYLGDKVLNIVSNPDSSITQIVDVIKYDQSMTANLLKICNSAYFGLKRRIESIKQAVAYLGIEKVACLAMLGNSTQNFKKAQSGYDLEAGELWRNSVSSALIAQNIAEKKHLKNIPLIFTAALIKDIGKVILHHHVQDSFKEIMAAVEHRDLTFIEAEKEIIGIDHAELGARVAEKWNFSPKMVDIIRNHHFPDRSKSTDLAVPIVYLADTVCMMIGIGIGADGLSYRYYQDVLDRLGLSDVDLQLTIAAFWEKLNGVEELVKLSLGDN